MFIAQIKAAIHHPLSCGCSGSVCTLLFSLAGSLKPQPRLPGDKPKSQKHTDAAKPVELRLANKSHCDNIRSRGRRGSRLCSIRRGLSSVEGPVGSFIDAGVVREKLALFWGAARPPLDSDASPSMHWRA